MTLLAAGDELQSTASRMSEYIRSLGTEKVPYEVFMAALEADSAVDAWTAARQRTPRTCDVAKP